jgi:hypothetical protein
MYDLEFLLCLPNYAAGSLFGYVGLGPGPELLPYFVALLSLVGAALLAVLQWPVTAFLAYLSKLRRRGDGPHDSQPVASTPLEMPHDTRAAEEGKNDN